MSRGVFAARAILWIENVRFFPGKIGWRKFYCIYVRCNNLRSLFIFFPQGQKINSRIKNAIKDQYWCVFDGNVFLRASFQLKSDTGIYGILKISSRTLFFVIDKLCVNCAINSLKLTCVILFYLVLTQSAFIYSEISVQYFLICCNTFRISCICPVSTTMRGLFASTSNSLWD